MCWQAELPSSTTLTELLPIPISTLPPTRPYLNATLDLSLTACHLHIVLSPSPCCFDGSLTLTQQSPIDARLQENNSSLPRKRSPRPMRPCMRKETRQSTCPNTLGKSVKLSEGAKRTRRRDGGGVWSMPRTVIRTMHALSTSRKSSPPGYNLPLGAFHAFM